MKHVAGLSCVALFVAVLAGAGVDLPAIAVADDGPAERSAQNPIELQNCLVKAVKTARLATDRPGVLAFVEPKEGDAVREGQVVARLMDDVAQANVDVAQLLADNAIEVEYAEKLNAVDANEFAKAEAANRQHANTVPDIELQRLKLAQERSRLQINKAKYDLKVNAVKLTQAVAELKTFRIIAPFDGVVTRVSKYRGEAIRQGDPILEVVSTDVVQVEGFVSVKDVWHVKPGAPVTVRLSANDADVAVGKKVFRGRVGFVDVVVSDVNKQTRVWAEVANPDNVLRPGLRATMTVFPGGSVGTGQTTSAAPSRFESEPNAARDSERQPQ